MGKMRTWVLLLMLGLMVLAGGVAGANGEVESAKTITPTSADGVPTIWPTRNF